MGYLRPVHGIKSVLACVCATALLAVSPLAIAQDADIEELVVTGSLIVSGEDSVSPVLIIGGDEIQNQPRLTLGDFFQVELPQNIAEDVETENSGMQGRLRGDRGVGLNLRGLGEENTLTLINGVRTIAYSVPNQGTGWRSIDINGQLPTIAMRSVQVLLDGGSAIYGTDALAGVVNMIPDYEFRGFRINANASAEEDNFNNFDTSYSFMWGGEIGDTSIVAAYERQFRNPIAAVDDHSDPVRYNPQPGDAEWDTAEFAGPLNWNPIIDATATDITGLVNNAGLLPNIVPAQRGMAAVNGDGNCTVSAMSGGSFSAGEGSFNEAGTDCYNVLRGLLPGLNSADYAPFLVPGLDITNSGFADPLCGMTDVTGLPGLTGGIIAGDLGGGVDPTDTRCFDFNRGARELFNRDTINESGLIAVQHEFSDSVRYAAELTWAENYIYDPFEWNTTNSGRGGPPLQTFSGTELRDGIVVDYSEAAEAAGAVDYTTGDYIVEWDHPGVIYNAALLTAAGVADADNPWLQNADPESGIIAGGVMAVVGAGMHYYNASGTHTSRFGNSLTIDLNDSWSALVGAAYATHSTTNYIDSIIPERLSLALDGLGGPNCNPATGTPGQGDCEYFNPFLSAAVPGIDPSLTNSNELVTYLRGPATIRYGAEFYTVSASLQGHFADIELAGGPVGMALGFEFRHDELEVDYDDFYNRGEYDLNDGVPFNDWGGVTETIGMIMDFSLPITDTFNVQVAGRVEHIDTAGRTHTSFTPKIGFNWEATDRLTIRAAYNESFRAPSIAHVVGESGLASANLSILQDTLGDVDAARDLLSNDNYDPHVANGQQTQFNVGRINVGSDLTDPQTATAWSIGSTYDITDDLRLTVSYLNIDFQDAIEVLGGADLLNTFCGNPVTLYDDTATTRESLATANGWDGIAPIEASLPSFWFEADGVTEQGVEYVIREPVAAGPNECYRLNLDGTPSVAYQPYVNIGSENMEVIDFSLNYSVATDIGTFGFSPGGSWTIADRKAEIVSNFVEYDVAGMNDNVTGLGRGAQEWRVNMPVSWSYDDHSMSLTGRWISGYTLRSTLEPDTEEYISADFSYRYRMNDNVTMGLSVSNVLNTQQVRTTTPAGIRRLGASVSMTF